MISLILLSYSIHDITILKNSIKVPFIESDGLISDVINSDSGTHELNQNIINYI